MRSYITVHSLVALALFGLMSRQAQAQSSCAADSDCVKGWGCQVVGGSTCSSEACPPGEACDPQPSTCVNVEIKSCRPAPCGSDSDCAGGMVCYRHTESTCVQSTCAPGQECPAPDCTPRTESACVPRYVLPCATASDCGSGFKCESGGEVCECSGSAGGADPSSDGGAPPPAPPEETCTCKPSEDLRCNVVPVTCGTNNDCAEGWTCTSLGSTSDCAGPAPALPTPGSGGEGNSAQDGGAPEPRCAASAELRQCMPPYYSLVQGGLGLGRGSDLDSGEAPTSGKGGSAPSNGGVATPTAPPGESSKDDATANAGCSVAHGAGSGSALGLLGVFGLFGVLRRRRAR